MSPHEYAGRRLALRGVLAATAVAGALSIAQAAPVDVVEITGGKVKGVETDVEGVTLFKGLPYAASTAGENRFRAPQPVEPWSGVKVADTWPDQVVQDVNLNPVGAFWGDEFYYDPAFLPKASENSLALNLYTPAKDTGDKLPVYVWFHGGGNNHGYASEIEFWAPKLAEKGIIVVQVQYRVGPLGFLALDELSKESPDGVSGNYNLLDLVAALQWVHDNIAGFGGDPNTVTIGGQSAGARNSVTLLKSPLAKPLFRRAVIESGFGGLLPIDFKTLEQAEADNPKAIESVFGKPMSLADLRAVPASELMNEKVGEKVLFMALNSAIGANQVIDGHVLTEDSVNLLRDGALDGHDLLIGSAADERTSLIGDPDGTMSPEEFADSMQKAYGDGWQDAYKASDPHHAYWLTLRAWADNVLQTNLVSAEYAIHHNDDVKAYVYYFDNPPPGRNSGFYGTFHSADLWYFFNSMRDDWPNQRPWTDADHRMADIMSSYLANFVKTGDPNGAGLPDWPQPNDGPAFMRFADGYAYPVETSPYPSRDALNRAAVLKKYDLDEGKLD